jgi:hypothetical protein
MMDLKHVIKPKETKKTVIKFGEEELNVSYKPMAYTAELEMRMEAARSKPASTAASILSEILVEWDLLENGEPVPITKERLQKIPLEFLGMVFEGITKENSPNSMTVSS